VQDRIIIMSKLIQLGWNSTAGATLAGQIPATKELTDHGSDGVVPVGIAVFDPNAESLPAAPTYAGAWKASLEKATSRNGTMRILLKTVFPVRGIVEKKNCACSEDAVAALTADATIHTVVTLPKSVVDALKSADSTQTMQAGKALNTAIRAHLSDILSGFGGTTVFGTESFSPNADVEPHLIKEVDSSDIRPDGITADVVLWQSEQVPANLLREIRGTGSDRNI
jgi:hypothetical protein